MESVLNRVSVCFIQLYTHNLKTVLLRQGLSIWPWLAGLLCRQGVNSQQYVCLCLVLKGASIPNKSSFLFPPSFPPVFLFLRDRLSEIAQAGLRLNNSFHPISRVIGIVGLGFSIIILCNIFVSLCSVRSLLNEVLFMIQNFWASQHLRFWIRVEQALLKFLSLFSLYSCVYASVYVLCYIGVCVYACTHACTHTFIVCLQLIVDGVDPLEPVNYRHGCEI